MFLFDTSQNVGRLRNILFAISFADLNSDHPTNTPWKPHNGYSAQNSPLKGDTSLLQLNSFKKKQQLIVIEVWYNSLNSYEVFETVF